MREKRKPQTISAPVKNPKFHSVREKLEQAKINQRQNPSPENGRQVQYWQNILNKLEGKKPDTKT